MSSVSDQSHDGLQSGELDGWRVAGTVSARAIHETLIGAAMGAVLALTNATAAGLIADGIRLNSVAPGTVDTPWMERLLERESDHAGANEQPLLKRLTRMGSRRILAVFGRCLSGK